MISRVTEVGPRIRELEQRRDLLRHKLDGWCVWPLFRMTVAMALVDPDSKPAAVSDAGYGLAAQIRIAGGDAAAWVGAPRKVRTAVVTCSSYRAECENGRWKDVMFDDYVPAFGSEFRIERINNRDMYERNAEAAFPSRMTTTWMVVAFQHVVSRLSASRDMREVAAALLRDLEVEHMLGPLNMGNIIQRLAAFRCQRKMWRALLRRLGACAVLFDDGYYQHDLVAGAREAGTRACEMQHGIFLEDGAEYSWGAQAIARRDEMPLPDRLFLFGDHWRDLLAKDGFWGERARVVGSARMDRHRVLGAARASDSCTLVVTTQGLSREALARFLADTLALCNDWRELKVVLKLHPVFDRDPAPYRTALGHDGRVRIVRGSELPATLDLLREADFHASIYSACHYEALGLRVPTIILPLPAHDIVQGLQRAGHARLARSPAALLEILRSGAGAGVGEDVSYRYFRSGAVENLERELDELCPVARG